MGKSIHQVVEEPLQDIPLVEVDPVVVGDHDPVVTINIDDTHQDQGGESNANTNHGERQTSAKVHISAPSNLSAGYQLPVLVNGEPRLVRVVSYINEELVHFHTPLSPDSRPIPVAPRWRCPGPNV